MQRHKRIPTPMQVETHQSNSPLWWLQENIYMCAKNNDSLAKTQSRATQCEQEFMLKHSMITTEPHYSLKQEKVFFVFI